MRTTIMDSAFCSAILLTTFLSLISISSSTQLSRDIDDYVASLVECKGVTGMAVTVVRGDRVLHRRGYGYADVKSGRKVRDHTRFCVASLTKAFTATLLAMLLEETRHDWDTPIAVLMPGLVFPDAYRTQELSLRDILSHKVGYPSYDFLWLSHSMSLDDVLRRLRYLEPVRPFRTDFTYSNLMYILAGKVAEHLGRRSWELLIRERILKPLGMNQTGFAWEAAVVPEVYAKPHRYYPETGKYGPLPDEAITDISHSLSAASICTTAHDMALWMHFLLNRASSDVIKLSPLMDEIFKAQTALRGNWNEHTFRPDFTPGKYVDYGMGWFTGNYRGYKYHDHYGLMPAYYSIVALLPDQQIGVFSTVNGAADTDLIAIAPFLINTFILDRMLNETPYKSSKEICDFMPDEPSQLKNVDTPQFASLIPYDPLVGHYAHPVFGNISIYTDPETEALHLKYGTFEFKLELDEDAKEEGRFKIIPVKWWTWICTHDEDFVQFSPYQDGGKALQIAIPCFELSLADMYFERDLKLSEIERYRFEENPSLKIACIQSGQARGQVISVLLLMLASIWLNVT